MRNMRNFFFISILVMLCLPYICISEITSKTWLQQTKSFHLGLNTSKSSEISSPSIKTALWQTGDSWRTSPFHPFSNSSNSSEGTDEKGIIHSAVHDLKYGLRTTFSDFLHIYSSPSRMSTSGALLTSGVLILGGVIYTFDQEIYDIFKRNKDNPIYKPVRHVGEFFEPLGLMGFTNKYLFIVLFTGYIFDIEPMVSISADILESYVIAGVAKNAANVIIGRRRPSAGVGPNSFEFGRGTSFPSGHSLNIVQVASILSYHFDNSVFKAIAYSVAGTVLLQRITSDSHWPSDVYAGAVLGWFISHELIDLKRNRKLSVTPVFRDDARGMDIRIAYCF